MWSLFSSRRRQASRPRRAPCKPRLETLENRWVPSAFVQSAGGPLIDSGQAIGTDAAGNVYVAGNVGGTLSAIDTDAYVAKYSSAGILDWSRVFSGRDPGGNSFGDSANAIAVDPRTGDAYVAGDFRARMDFGNNVVLTSTGAIDGFVIKLDTNGTAQWAHQFASNGNYGPPTYDRLGTLAPKGIALDHAGNVDVTGFFSGHMDMDPANPGLHYLDSTNIHPSSYVVQLDGGGNFVWEAQAANPVDDINVYAVAVDAQNNVYTTGTFGNFNYFNDMTANNSNLQSANALTLNSPNISNLYVWKLNAGGTNVWVTQVTSQAYNAPIWGLGIAVDAQGAIYTTGSFNGASVDFDPTVAHAGNPDIVTSPTFNFNTYVDKMDSGGHWLWTRQITSSGDNWGTGLALDSAGNPYIAGYLTADSLLGNILQTPASATGNSFIAELNPAGDFLCAQKSADLAPASTADLAPVSDRAAAIAVDGAGFVDITGAFAPQMQWPGLPLLTNGSGGSDTDIFTVKTQLTCSPITHNLVGTVLTINGTDQADLIQITDDRHWGILVTLGTDAPLAYQGLTQIAMNTRGGNDMVNVALGGPDTLGEPNAFMPPNLSVSFGSGNDTFLLSANFGQADPPEPIQPWNVQVKTGDGNDMVHASIVGSMPMTMATSLGAGIDTSIYELHEVTEMPLPETLSVNGGSGADDIRVISDVHPEPKQPGAPLQQPITVNINGGTGTSHILNEWLFDAVPSNPGDPLPTSDIPMISNIRTRGISDDVRVIYGVVPPLGDLQGFQGLCLNAPIAVNLDGARGSHNTFAVDFFHDPPSDQPPPLFLNNAFSVNMRGGSVSDVMNLDIGSGDTHGIVIWVMPSGSVAARLTAGAGTETVAANMFFDPRSTGQVNAKVIGGAGTDDLTLDVYGIADNLVNGVIDLGSGTDTVHHTANVKVIN